MVKFKIGFTITAETMFSMLSKFLPVEDLTVEEMAPMPPPTPTIVPPQRKLAQRVKRQSSKAMNLSEGINAIIMGALADGQPHPAIELKPLLEKAGFSPNSTGSRLQYLRERGIVEQVGDGTWRVKMSKALSA